MSAESPGGFGPPARKRGYGRIWKWAAPALLVAAAVAYVVFALVRGAPAATVVPAARPATIPDGPPKLAWPSQGQAAAAVQGIGLMSTHNSEQPTPIASLAKIMTAYLVLRDHPLRAGENGPHITVSPSDVAVYQADVAAGQSVVTVTAGEVLSERQALEGLLLPSGNNLATMLARWDAGSETAFVSKMNAEARTLDLTRTSYADASGADPATVSSAGDQVRLTQVALTVPAFAHIVSMPSATLPVAGQEANLDALLGQNGIVGVKTGSTSEAGGCFVFAARERVGTRRVTIVGAVLHQLAPGGLPNLIKAAFRATIPLLTSIRRVLVASPVVRQGATLAQVKTSWASPVAVSAAGTVTLVGWPGLPVHTTIAAPTHPAVPIAAGQDLGSAVLAAGDQRAHVRLLASKALAKPSLGWRVTHP